MTYKTYYKARIAIFDRKYILLMSLLYVCISSCKKDTSDADALQSRFDSGMVSYVQGSNVVLLNGTSYSFTPYFAGVPITLKEPAKSADSVIATVDPSLVAEYNELYLEKNPAISPNAFRVSHQGKFAVNAGATQAIESMHVELNDGSQLKDSTVYLVPVTLAAKNDSKLKYSLFFFKVLVTKGELQAKMFGSSVINGTIANRLKSGALQFSLSTIIPDSIKYRVTLNKLFPVNDVTIQATILTEAEVKAAIPKETFTGIAMPDNIAAVTKNLVTVSAGTLLSKDSLTVRFPNKSNLKKLQWYTTGIKIVTYTGSKFGVPPVPSDSARAYIRLFLN